MYFYPDNLFEEILIMQNGPYEYPKTDQKKKTSRIDLQEFSKGKWYLTVWDITNVLPRHGRVEEGIAAFPEEIPKRLIKLFTYNGETVLDPFLGSGTTSKVAKELGRNSYGYEIDLELKKVITRKVGYPSLNAEGDKIEVTKRKDAQSLKNELQKRIQNQRSTSKNRKNRNC